MEPRLEFGIKARHILEARKNLSEVIKRGIERAPPHKDTLRSQVMKRRGTRGVGIGDRKIVVYVDEREKKPDIPIEIDGTQVETIKTPEFVIYPDFQPTLGENTGRKEIWRPIPGGVAGGHAKLGGYGTISGMVYKNGVIHVLSNNHVFARSNNAKIGDYASQPQGTKNAFGVLADFIPITQGVKVDCAIVRPFNDFDIAQLILKSDVDYEPNVHTTGVMAPQVKLSVVKSGARTGFASGTIESIHATITVGYGAFGQVRLEDQIVTNLIGWKGDSGSLVLDKKTNKAVGLLFAGDGTTRNVHNDINNVMNALNIDMPTTLGEIPKMGELEITGVPDKAEIWLPVKS